MHLKTLLMNSSKSSRE